MSATSLIEVKKRIGKLNILKGEFYLMELEWRSFSHRKS